MRLHLKRLLHLGVMITPSIPLDTEASVIRVCSDCHYASVESAVAEAQPFDTVVIGSGDYRVSTITILRSLTVVGLPGSQLVSKDGAEIFVVAADSVTLYGLRLEGVKLSYTEDRAAIRLRRCKRFKIIRNTIVNCYFAIYLEHSSNGLILGNKVIGSQATSEAAAGNGVHAWYCNNVLIIRNTVSGMRDGIYFEFVKNSAIIGNNSFGNMRYGLHFMFSDSDMYESNTFSRNGAGVAVMYSRQISMGHNTFVHNWGQNSYGLLLKEIYDGEISGNDFSSNTIGIFVEGSNRITYKRNTFSRNGWAVKMSGGCMSNSFTENNFMSNSMDLVVSTEGFDNMYDGNYWSSYIGYDLNHDDVADVPYYPVKLYSYILEQSPEAIVLMRSLFVDIINFSEKVTPVFTPKTVVDRRPRMNPVE